MAKTKKKEVTFDLFVMSNTPSPRHYALIQMLYDGAFNNEIGLMEALNSETGSTELLIIGAVLNRETGKMDTFPLARVLDPQDVQKYRAPTGTGDFVKHGADLNTDTDTASGGLTASVN